MVQGMRAARANRWAQLWLGVVCMVLIANLQYGWTLFVPPMHAAHGWAIAGIQVAFAIFVAMETWLTPLAGWIVDGLGARRGPPLMIGVGGLLVGVAWIVDSQSQSLGGLYAGATLSGIGAGAVYATCVGNALKWFPDKRGLAVGLTAGGFGAGAALTVVPIRLLIAGAGYQAAFFWFGLGQGVLLLLLAPVMHGPVPGERVILHRPAPAVPQASHSTPPSEVLRSPLFWLLYVMFVLVAASGLMATAQIAPIAHDFGVATHPLLFGAGALTVALVIDNVMNGLARPFFGAVSDRIGRENTMGVAFSLGALSYALLATIGSRPWAFVICAGLVFFTWGEIFSLFPATCTDLFGPKFATTNTSLLYTAKGTAAWLVPLANVLKAATGSWHTVFVVSAVANLVVVACAVFVLRPARGRVATAGPVGRAA
jgi:MFS transporter, OFA family, oxalate/formate antiporter